MKNKGIIIFLITLLLCLTIFISTLFVLLLNGKVNLGKLQMFAKSANKEIYNNTLDDFPKNIVIDVDSANINIKHSKDEKVHLIVYGDENKNKLDVNNTNSTLKIKYKRHNCHFMCFNIKKGKIDLFIPEFYDGDFNIKSDVGDIYLDSFINSYLNIDADVGNVNVKDINITKIKSDVGNVNVNNITGYFDIDVDTGDITIDYANIDRDSKINVDVGEITVNNIDDINIDAKTDVGEKNIKNNNKNSDITLKVRNDVGDININ
ncbi:MAG: DUF4097 domain-containing protein [Firmicutes bacterium]|nr:DUF4097 domain-containing protein [Bacillota bacterium]